MLEWGSSMPTLWLQQKFYSVLWDPVWLPSVRGEVWGKPRRSDWVFFFIFSWNIPWLCCDVWAVRRSPTPVSVMEKILRDSLFLFQSEHALFGALLMVRVLKHLFKTILFFVCTWTSYQYNRWMCGQKPSVFSTCLFTKNVKEEERLVVLEQWLVYTQKHKSGMPNRCWHFLLAMVVRARGTLLILCVLVDSVIFSLSRTESCQGLIYIVSSPM